MLGYRSCCSPCRASTQTQRYWWGWHQWRGPGSHLQGTHYTGPADLRNVDIHIYYQWSQYYSPTTPMASAIVVERSCIYSCEFVSSTSMATFTMDLLNMSMHMAVASDSGKDWFRDAGLPSDCCSAYFTMVWWQLKPGKPPNNIRGIFELYSTNFITKALWPPNLHLSGQICIFIPGNPCMRLTSSLKISSMLYSVRF